MATLDKLAVDLARGAVTMASAAIQTINTLAGEVRVIGGRPSRVVPSIGATEAELKALRDYIVSQDYADLHRWAGAFVQLHALLALDLFQQAAELVRRVAGTDKVPAGADDYVVAMIDALLEHPTQLPAGLETQFMAARRRLRGASAPPGDAFGTVVKLFEREGWVHFADREAGKILIEFISPVGQTRLVCSITNIELSVIALSVIRATAPQIARIARELAASFAGVRHEHGSDGGVTLHYTLKAADTLSQTEVRQAIVLVNGACEHILAKYS